MNDQKDLVDQLNKELAIELPDKISYEELKQQLSVYINDLIQHQFEKLISLLYRIDVNESKIKSFLQHQPGENAADIIADLIIERQLEKIKSRKEFNRGDNTLDEEERW